MSVQPIRPNRAIGTGSEAAGDAIDVIIVQTSPGARCASDDGTVRSHDVVTCKDRLGQAQVGGRRGELVRLEDVSFRRHKLNVTRKP